MALLVFSVPSCERRRGPVFSSGGDLPQSARIHTAQSPKFGRCGLSAAHTPHHSTTATNMTNPCCSKHGRSQDDRHGTAPAWDLLRQPLGQKPPPQLLTQSLEEKGQPVWALQNPRMQADLATSNDPSTQGEGNQGRLNLGLKC